MTSASPILTASCARIPISSAEGNASAQPLPRLLICGPSLLIADEPLSALDTITQAEILDLLARLKSQMNLAMIFITHSAGVLSALADRMVVLRDGVIVASGTLDQLRLSADPYVRGRFSRKRICFPPPSILGSRESNVANARGADLAGTRSQQVFLAKTDLWAEKVFRSGARQS